MSGEIVEFPGQQPPAEGYSEQYIDKLHSQAFRDLEGEVCDLDRMGEIARNLIMNCAAKCRRRSHLAPSAFGTETFSSLNDLLTGLRKMRGIHEPSLGERRVPYGRDHERHFPDRGRAFHFDWNALKEALDLGNAADARSRTPQA
jgi:hypothetical protein